MTARGPVTDAVLRRRAEWGRPAAAREREYAPGCDVPECGTRAPEAPGRVSASVGLARVVVRGSREPARWWCRGWCAAYGRALAELRVDGAGVGS